MSATSAIARDIMAHVHTFCTHHPESLFNALWPELSWGLVLRFRPTTTSTSFCKGLQAGKQHLRQLLRNLFCCVVLFLIHLFLLNLQPASCGLDFRFCPTTTTTSTSFCQGLLARFQKHCCVLSVVMLFIHLYPLYSKQARELYNIIVGKEAK